MTIPTPNRIRVWKHAVGIYLWDCSHETCLAPLEEFRSGASTHWEIAQTQADSHGREWHHRIRHYTPDTPTPPGGMRFEWGENTFAVIPAQRSAGE